VGGSTRDHRESGCQVFHQLLARCTERRIYHAFRRGASPPSRQLWRHPGELHAGLAALEQNPSEAQLDSWRVPRSCHSQKCPLAAGRVRCRNEIVVAVVAEKFVNRREHPQRGVDGIVFRGFTGVGKNGSGACPDRVLRAKARSISRAVVR